MRAGVLDYKTYQQDALMSEGRRTDSNTAPSISLFPSDMWMPEDAGSPTRFRLTQCGQRFAGMMRSRVTRRAGSIR